MLDMKLVKSGKHKIQEMGKKTNNSLGATATDEAMSGASQKKHLRPRKPKFEVGKPKQGFDKKKKDKKRKRKETAKQLLHETRLMKAEIRASHQLVDKFHLILKLGTTRTKGFDYSVGKEKRRPINKFRHLRVYHLKVESTIYLSVC
ncbi:hypothetical protein V6N13_121458 [Hibiscus sabdariffa]